MIAETILTKKPNWDFPFILRYKWNTTIHRGINGKEKRNANLSWPRRSIKYSIQFSNSQEKIELQNQIYFNLDSVWGIPLWMAEFTCGVLTQGQVIIPTIPPESREQFNVGQPILIVNTADETDYITRTIASFGEYGHINVDTAFGAGEDYSSAYIYPIIQGLIQSSIKYTNNTHTVGNFTITLEEKYDADACHYVTKDHGFSKLGRFPVFNKRPNWAEKIISNVNLQYKLQEYIGAWYKKTYQDEADILLELRYDCTSREETLNLEHFFNQMEGRKGRFYIPTHTRDFDIDGAISGGGSTLTIEDYSSFNNTYENQEGVGSHIYLDKDNETDSANRVSSAGATSLSLDNPLGFSVPSGETDVVGQSFLLPSRFDTDEIEIRYLSHDVVTCKVRTKSLNDPDFGLHTISTTTTTTSTTSTTTTTV